MDISQLKRIALFRLSAVGDVVLWVPVVRAIQRAYPHIKLTWMISPVAYSLLKGLPGVEFLVIEKPTTLSAYWRCGRQLSHASYDLLLAAQASWRAHVLYPWIRAPFKLGFDAKRAKDAHGCFINRRIPFAREHLLESFMRFAHVLGVEDTRVVWDLPIEFAHHEWARKQLSIRSGRWMAVNPMASKVERSWVLDRYVKVIDEAAERWGVNVVLTGGPGAEEQRWSRVIAERAKTPCLVLTGQTQLKQLAALLGAVDVLLAPDTGPVHIANAMGTPVVGLYAVATPVLTGPYGAQARVIDKYPEAVRQFLNQDADTVAWGTRVHHQEAMRLITVEEVMNKLGEMYANYHN